MMAFKKAEFIKSSPSLTECPEPDKPEICFAGRSNVGKSSLINKLVNRKNLARTSNTPGKTRHMNYYLIDERFYFVDLPGFGYAKVPKKEQERWAEEIRKYLLERPTLELVIHLVDSRHEPTHLDEEFFYWLGSNEIPFSVLLTKCDKISGNKVRQSHARLQKLLHEMNIEVPVFTCSAETGAGIDEVLSLIHDFSQSQIN
ncbi:MAG: ribosome biogenesis GTP-binding protein YihA/YsxC [Balneolaceae bacterium]